MTSATSAYLLSQGATQTRRPRPVRQSPLPPWDPNDPHYGEVHTTPPSELIIPPVGTDPVFMRADFNGVTLDAHRWGDAEAEIQALNILGANSTPYRMLMTPMLVLYPRKWQDADLTEHAERGYEHFIISGGDSWNLKPNGFDPTPQAIVTWARYLQSWGFKIVYWAGQPMINDPTLHALVDAHAIDWAMPGEEVDGKVTAEQYEAVLDDTLSVVGHGIPVGAHFTANYPEGFPRDTFVTNWAKHNGRVHLCWQADWNNSAGKQAAMCYYARQRVNLGLIGGNGQPAPDSRVVAFETMAFGQLMGQYTEGEGNKRTLELLYATRNDPRIRPMDGGYGNGARLPDGSMC